jgi:hypothetical protein
MAQGVQYVCYIDETGYYLGDVGRIADFLKLDSEDLRPTWVPTSLDGRLVLLRAEDVRGLWLALGRLGARFREINESPEMDQTVHLFMPCGHVTRYIAFDDFPSTSQPCSCGDPNHWLIRYTEDES